MRVVALPLPRTTARLVEEFRGRHHPGLLLDRWVPLAGATFDIQLQRDHLFRVCAASGQWPPDFDDLANRRRAVLRSLGAVTWTRTTAWRLTLHLARASALENAGICLHPIYGMPYIPGTGLKGLAHAYAHTEWLAKHPDRQAAWDRLLQVFGWAPAPHLQDQIEALGVKLPTRPARSRRGQERDRPEVQREDIEASAGRVIFCDAWPVSAIPLELDIVNAHYPEYYRERAANRNPSPPGDYQAPVPVYFLAIPPGTEFEFALGLLNPSVPQDLVDQARTWLDEALSLLGAGAKTSAGYGYFLDQPASPEPARTDRGPSAGIAASPPAHPSAGQAGAPFKATLKAGTRVRAVLLPERTKKNRWKAQIVGTPFVGVIAQEPDPTWQVGQTIECVVISSDVSGSQIQLKCR